MSLGAEIFGFSWDDMLWKMSLSQLLNLIEVRNDRERRAHEEAERRASIENANPGYKTTPNKNLLSDENIPTVSEIMGVFGAG